MKAKRARKENQVENRAPQPVRTLISDLEIAPKSVLPATTIPDRKRPTDKFPHRNLRHGNAPRPVRQI